MKRSPNSLFNNWVLMTCVKIAHDSVMGFWAFKWNFGLLGF